jgi:ribonuclease VapC
VTTSRYVFDANAILDFVEAGPGFGTVERLLAEALHRRKSIAISTMNWGEVFYFLWTHRGEDRARKVIATLAPLPISIVPVDLALALMAAEIKAVHKIPYVDCVAAALAQLSQSTLVTSDRDFEKLGRRVSVLWLARPKE